MGTDLICGCERWGTYSCVFVATAGVRAKNAFKGAMLSASNFALHIGPSPSSPSHVTDLKN